MLQSVQNRLEAPAWNQASLHTTHKSMAPETLEEEKALWETDHLTKNLLFVPAMNTIKLAASQQQMAVRRQGLEKPSDYTFTGLIFAKHTTHNLSMLRVIDII